MNPRERHHLQSLRKRLDLAYQELTDFLDTIGMTEAPLDNTHTSDGPVLLNQHMPAPKPGDKYWARLRDVGYTPPCSCEFGWQPECPAHGDDEHRVPTADRIDLVDPCDEPDHTPGNACPVADHQNERVCRCADTGRPSMCPRHRDPDARYIEEARATTFTPKDPRTHHWAGCPQNHGPESWCPNIPQPIIDRYNALLRGDDHEVVTAEEAEAAHQARCGTPDIPTPKEAFGNGEEQVGG